MLFRSRYAAAAFHRHKMRFNIGTARGFAFMKMHFIASGIFFYVACKRKRFFKRPPDKTGVDFLKCPFSKSLRKELTARKRFARCQKARRIPVQPVCRSRSKRGQIAVLKVPRPDQIGGDLFCSGDVLIRGFLGQKACRFIDDDQVVILVTDRNVSRCAVRRRCALTSKLFYRLIGKKKLYTEIGRASCRERVSSPV